MVAAAALAAAVADLPATRLPAPSPHPLASLPPPTHPPSLPPSLPPTPRAGDGHRRDLWQGVRQGGHRGGPAPAPVGQCLHHHDGQVQGGGGAHRQGPAGPGLWHHGHVQHRRAPARRGAQGRAVGAQGAGGAPQRRCALGGWVGGCAGGAGPAGVLPVPRLCLTCSQCVLPVPGSPGLHCTCAHALPPCLPAFFLLSSCFLPAPSLPGLQRT